jgi:hypothetical protein
MRISSALLLTALLFTGPAAIAETAIALRGGTLGVGLDVDFGLTETLTLRVGYSLLDYDETVNDSDVRYDGDLKLRNATALLDWHALGGGFRFSFGAVGVGTKVDVVGRPTGGTYEIGDDVFTAAQVGSLRGEIEFGNSVAPYVGIGWGNTVDAAERITVVFDVGAIYAGTPDVKLTALCGAGVPVATCNRLAAAVQEEEDEIADEASIYEWYPVISIGFAVRF